MILTPPVAQSLTIHSDSADISLDATGRWKTFRSDKGVFRNTLTGKVVYSALNHVEIISERQKELLKKDLLRELNKLIHLAENGKITEEESSLKSSEARVSALKNGLNWITLHESNSAERFKSVYPEKITMLPPDRYKDIVILPATGCPHSECTFCSLYDDAGFKPLSNIEFENHLKGVKNLFGDALEERTGIFLGSASALSLGQRKMTGVIEKLMEEFGFLKRGVATFFDPYHAPRRNSADFKVLKDLGLRQVTIGLESGLPELRGLWGKSPQLNSFSEAVRQLKKAGIQVAITILTGFDAGAFHQKHVEATSEIVRSLPLEKSDIIYLSPYFPARLTERESTIQLQSFKKVLKNESNAKVVSYHVDRFHYFV
jgi:radical SAM superfamily enzyme YgiQ (UPF0313 family)